MAITWPAKNNYATGDVLTATNMNGIGDDLNALFDNSFYAGKNKFLNSDFLIWQRGTSFSSNGYTADRWNSVSDATVTTSRQSFTLGTAPVAGYEGTYFLRQAKSAGGSYMQLEQRIEDVRTFANKTVTLSFWAKADGATTLAPYCTQNFGSGGSAVVDTSLGTIAITTSWARYSVTFTVPSISGKTIGTSSYLQITPTRFASSAAITIDLWGAQLEAGSTATPFQTATGTIQGELAACQRYYYRQTSGQTYSNFAVAIAENTSTAYTYTTFPVTMRTAPTSIDYSTVGIGNNYNLLTAVTPALQSNTQSPYEGALKCTGGTGLTGGAFYFLTANNSTTAYIAFNAEL